MDWDDEDVDVKDLKVDLNSLGMWGILYKMGDLDILNWKKTHFAPVTVTVFTMEVLNLKVYEMWI